MQTFQAENAGEKHNKMACFVPPMAKAACTLSILPVRYIAGDPFALGRRGG